MSMATSVIEREAPPSSGLGLQAGPARWPEPSTPAPDPDQIPTRAHVSIARVSLVTLAAVMLGFCLNVVVGSRLEHRVAQAGAFDRLRQELALATAPLGPRNRDHSLLELGAPMALIEIPTLGVKEVVEEGTTGAVLMSGPGHLPSTPFPGGAGTSVILGRAAAYGGPFARIGQLHDGALVKVTTQVGKSTFRVIDRRRAGDVIPTLASDKGRLTLATATGPTFLPSGVVWVDADLIGPPLAAQKPVVERLPSDERPLGNDPGALPGVWLWSAVLVLIVTAAFWSWRRRGAAQAWIIFSAPIVLVGYFLGGQISIVLPNLM